MKPKAFTFDIDSTLANTSVRAATMINKENRDLTDWEAYALACESDTPTDTVELLRVLSEDYSIVLVTARPESAREVTVAWLQKHDIPWDDLVMDDGTHDSIVSYKVAAIRKVSEVYDIKVHVDDWWSIGVDVKKELNIPTVIVRSYAPEDNRATF